MSGTPGAERLHPLIDPEDVTRAAAMVSQALGEIEAIRDAAPMGLTPTYNNLLRRPRDTRAFTLKDARPRAAYAAKLLREAWDLLEPPLRSPRP